ncbi:MAG: Sir2 family NAD-dependent protein deacetylase [Hyphomicrobiales bacterium]|nr:Sir2 family NAD-dependent protein deacetylase [Hyphomicrobiales bacterium]
MIVSSVQEGQALLRELIVDSDCIAGFTGAGISTESGIPDFRSKNSSWHRNPPMPFDEFMASEDNRIVAWQRKFAQDEAHGNAQPNKGHYALANLVARGRMNAVITQNIDGLHAAAGVPDEKVIELHGNGTYATCLVCGIRHELKDVRQRFEANGKAPKCLCGGPVKTATISFGQSMPQEAMRRAQRATMNCDLFLAIGSSLVVYPAAGFPLLAKENGAKLVIINREETALDDAADLVLRTGIGDVLSPFSEPGSLN